jgi:hypothetical protein
MLPLVVVSLNTYLVPRQFNKNRNTVSEERATRIRQFLRDKQLCFLQEVWGSSFENLVDHDIHNTPAGRVPIVFAFSLLKKKLPQFLIDTLHTGYLYGSGGLYDLSAKLGEHTVKCMYRRKHTFSISQSRSLKGVEATLWTIPQWGDHRQLLVFNTHLDPSTKGTENRRTQVTEILDFMAQTFDELSNQGADNETGVPLCPTQDWSSTGVLVMGDFNIKASSDEYQQTLKRHEWTDYFLGVEQHTYAKENSLAFSASAWGRIDYIFGVHRFGKYTFLPLLCLEKSIPIPDVGQELSDHYPLVVQLVPTMG